MISFAEKHPELVQEWSDENEARPEEVSYGSNKRILWRASCGHSWEATVKNRGNGSGCPFCSGNQVLYGFNDLASVYPELAAEWSELNYPLYPSAVRLRRQSERHVKNISAARLKALKKDLQMRQSVAIMP